VLFYSAGWSLQAAAELGATMLEGDLCCKRWWVLLYIEISPSASATLLRIAIALVVMMM
jgi:hypothetical protein